MSFRPPTSSSLVKIETWLRHLGLTKIEKSNNELIVRLKIDGLDDGKYVLHISLDEDILIIESFVSNNVSGAPEKIVFFQEALLGYNGSADRIYFALVPTKGKTCFILRISQSFNTVDLEEFKALLDCFHDAYTSDIPEIKNLAKKLELKFEGRDSGLETLLRTIFQKP